MNSNKITRLKREIGYDMTIDQKIEFMSWLMMEIKDALDFEDEIKGGKPLSKKRP